VTGCLTKSPCTISDLQSKRKQSLESLTARRLLQPPEIQTWSNTFCPNILASSSQSATPDATSSPSSTGQAAPSTTTSSSSTSSLGGSSTATAAGGSVSAFGANTLGTTWGMIPQSDSTANRGPALEAVSIILLCVAAMILALRFLARINNKSMR